MKVLKMKIIMLLILILSGCGTIDVNKLTNLNNSVWFFREADTKDSLKAVIPGSVQTDLYLNKKVGEFYYRLNENDIQSIGNKKWIYTTNFNLSESEFSKNNIEMVFNGLDTYAEVKLNGSIILNADNFFRVWNVNVKQLVKLKDNRLEITFYPVPDSINNIKKSLPFNLLDDNVYVRKPAYHFGWDWGPVLITAGIWKPITINSWNNAKLIDLQIFTKKIAENQAELELVYEIESTNPGEYSLKTINETTGETFDKTCLLEKGMNKIGVNLIVDNPRLWWSNGLGEAFLYSFKGELEYKNDIVESISKKYGIRTVRLVQKPDSLGKSFYFELNGVPVFAKGANYIPLDMVVTNPKEKDYKNIIKQTLEANMNMLRVWGGGFYENDIFYELCDENGILVWQDFMYACSMYPGDEKFLENAGVEAIQNIKRLRNHPSIVLWCGNNENYIGWKDWKWPKKFSKTDSATVWNDYEKLFHKLLPDIIKEYDPDRDYWPSSPKHGWGYPVNADGDVHYWGVWHAQEPFENFGKKEFIGRFMSEYGFQGCPEFNSIKKFTDSTDWDIKSDVMKLHQKHRIGYPVIDKYLKWYYNQPKDFQSYLYLSQLNQALGIGYAIETHRASMPHCMGTLYWQINDLYPVTSWSSIDVYGNWKALHYKVRDLYKQIIIVPQTDNDILNVKIVSDKLTEEKGKLKLKLMDFSGRIISEVTKEVSIKENSSKIYYETSLEKMLGAKRPNQVVLVTELMVDDKTIYSGTKYFVHPKDLELELPQITSTKESTQNGYLIKLKSDKLVKNVFISFENIQGKYSDNYFDMLPDVEYNILFTPEKPDVKLGEVKLFHLLNSFNK